MDAWGVLTSNSEAPAGSDAWTHLVNQHTGGVTYINPAHEIELNDQQANLQLSQSLALLDLVQIVSTTDMTADSASIEVRKTDGEISG